MSIHVQITTRPLPLPVRLLAALLAAYERRIDSHAPAGLRSPGLPPFAVGALLAAGNPAAGLRIIGAQHAVGTVVHVDSVPAGVCVVADVVNAAGEPFPAVDHGRSVVAAFPGALFARPVGTDGGLWAITYPLTADPLTVAPAVDAAPTLAPAGRRRRRVRLLVAGVVIAATAATAGAAGALYAQGARHVCRAEYDTACVWVGPLQGDGRGAVIVNGPDAD